MRRSRVWNLALIASTAAPVSLAAQLAPRLEAGTEIHSLSGRRAAWSAIGGAMSLDRSWLSLAGTAAGLTDGERWTSRGALEASLVSPALGPLQLSAHGTAARGGPVLTPAWSVTAGGRASLRAGAWGAWAGFDAHAAAASDTTREIATPSLGGWRHLGSAILSLSLSARRFRVDGTPSTVRQEARLDSIFNDTLGNWTVFEHFVTVGDSGRAARQLRWDQAEARLFWSAGRLAADAAVGGRFGGDFGREMWADITALYALSSRVVLVAGAGSQPGQPANGWRRRATANIGVRLLGGGAAEPAVRVPAEIRPDAAAFELLPVRAGVYTLAVHVPHARAVELSGDFTDWKPIAMMSAGDGRWEATVAIAPGTHHVNVRVNGERWMAPPGMPEIEDEFNGTVGLLVVP